MHGIRHSELANGVNMSNYRGAIVLYSARLIQVVLGCIFVYASLPKIQHPYDFLESVIEYQLLRAKTAVMLAAILPWFELILGVALVSGACIWPPFS